jgi:hypothetical protein
MRDLDFGTSNVSMSKGDLTSLTCPLHSYQSPQGCVQCLLGFYCRSRHTHYLFQTDSCCRRNEDKKKSEIHACPEGAWCTNGKIYPKAGYWVPKDGYTTDATKVRKCLSTGCRSSLCLPSLKLCLNWLRIGLLQSYRCLDLPWSLIPALPCN